MELNIILGLKLKKYRTERDLSLKELSELSGLSPSYLNEIEKGKKYPKTDKILSLSSALGVSYDELVSTQLSEDLTPLSSLLQGDFLDDLPLELFGIEEGNLVDIMSGSPSKFSSLIETLIEIGRNFDLKLEDFLFAALRAYQERHHNYFGELEMAVDRFRSVHGFGETPTMSLADLESFLKTEYKYEIDYKKLSRFPNLKEFRSVYEMGKTPVLYINPLLLEAQKKFILAKEIGFNFLG
jgi:Predicted transcriptional regulator with C-terminal CBS domains